MYNFIKIFIVLFFLSTSFAHAVYKPSIKTKKFDGKSHPKERKFTFIGNYETLEKIDFTGRSQPKQFLFRLKGQFPKLNEIKVDGRRAYPFGKYSPHGILLQVFGEAPNLEIINLETKNAAIKVHLEKTPILKKIDLTSVRGKITLNLLQSGMTEGVINLKSTSGNIDLILKKGVAVKIETNMPLEEKKRKSLAKFSGDAAMYEMQSLRKLFKDVTWSGEWVYYTVERILMDDDLELVVDPGTQLSWFQKKRGLSEKITLYSRDFDSTKPHIFVKIEDEKGTFYVGLKRRPSRKKSP